LNAPLPPTHFDDGSAGGLRFREAGDMVLDRYHRDGRVDDRWLGLSVREFALLWRLAETPGERLGEAQLCGEAWRIVSDPENDRIEPYIARIRDKLAEARLGHLICTDGDSRHFLEASPRAGLLRLAASDGSGT